MTTATVRVTQTRVRASEWIKLRSLRSTVLALTVSVLVIVAIGLLAGTVRPKHGTQVSDPTGLSLRGVFGAQLVISVLGVLLMSGEYSTGMIRASLTAVPRRLPVLWAKLGVFTLVALVTSVAGVLAAFSGAQAELSANHLAGASLSDPSVLRAVIGAALYLTGAGLMGMALGAIIRYTAGAVSALTGLLIILPIAAQALPATWFLHVYPYLPSQPGMAIMHVQSAGGGPVP
jgi:ABC-2 type transport system permease protein